MIMSYEMLQAPDKWHRTRIVLLCCVIFILMLYRGCNGDVIALN